MMTSVAPIIPVLFILAAIKTELSSAVANTDSSARLVARLTQKRISAHVGYTLLNTVKSIFLLGTRLLEIISYA